MGLSTCSKLTATRLASISYISVLISTSSTCRWKLARTTKSFKTWVRATAIGEKRLDVLALVVCGVRVRQMWIFAQQRNQEEVWYFSRQFAAATACQPCHIFPDKTETPWFPLFKNAKFNCFTASCCVHTQACWHELLTCSRNAWKTSLTITMTNMVFSRKEKESCTGCSDETVFQTDG